jgi:hypothetical protein
MIPEELDGSGSFVLAKERSCKYLLAFVYIPWCALYMSMMMNEISQHTYNRNSSAYVRG